MAILTKGARRNAHWYTRQGEPLHEVMKADGSGLRPTTLKDARRLWLMPSVTGINAVLASQGLENWKLTQMAVAALRTPKQERESEEYWCQRVRDAAFEQVDAAADLGTAVHAALQSAVAGEAYDEERYGAYVRPALAVIRDEGISVSARERVLMNAAHGYAGTADVLFARGEFGSEEQGVLDYKTKRTKPGEKVEAYVEHRLQLAAYGAAAYGEQALGRVRGINVFVSSTEPGRVEVVRHGDLTPDWEAFKLLCALWRYLRGYDPRCAGS